MKMIWMLLLLERLTYVNLLEEYEDAGWRVEHFPIIVGSRGFVGHSMRQLVMVRPN